MFLSKDKGSKVKEHTKKRFTKLIQVACHRITTFLTQKLLPKGKVESVIILADLGKVNHEEVLVVRLDNLKKLLFSDSSVNY